MTSAESFDSNAIEVNGIRFETLVPEPVVILPKKSLVKKILHLLQFLSRSPSSQLPSVPIKLGLSITNNTSKAFRFSFYPTLPTMMPQIAGSDGQEIKLLKRDFFRLMIQSESDFPLAIPGETVTFFLNAEILWCQGNHFVMIVTSTCDSFMRKSKGSTRSVRVVMVSEDAMY